MCKRPVVLKDFSMQGRINENMYIGIYIKSIYALGKWAGRTGLIKVIMLALTKQV